MRFILKSKRAFTLLEILITLVISSIIIISSLLIFFNSNYENLNQRKKFTKINEIEYTLNYIENELKNSFSIDVKDGNLHILNYGYNGFSANVSVQKIKNIKKITFKKQKEKEKFSLYRISLDILNKLDDGKNKLIEKIDDFEVFLEKNKITLKITYLNLTFFREITLKNLERFDYE